MKTTKRAKRTKMTKRTKRTREVGRSGVHDTKMKRRKAKKGGKPNFEDNEKGEKDEDDEKDEKDEEDERTSGPIRRARESGKKTKSTFFQNEKEGRSDSKNACLFFLTAAGARAKKNTTSGEEYQRMAMNLTGEFPDRDFLVSSPDREILNPRRRARRRRSPLAQTETTRSGNPQIEKSWMIGEARRRGRRSSSPGPRAHDRIRLIPCSLLALSGQLLHAVRPRRLLLEDEPHARRGERPTLPLLVRSLRNERTSSILLHGRWRQEAQMCTIRRAR